MGQQRDDFDALAQLAALGTGHAPPERAWGAVIFAPALAWLPVRWLRRWRRRRG